MVSLSVPVREPDKPGHVPQCPACPGCPAHTQTPNTGRHARHPVEGYNSRHDYARIWKGLNPRTRNARITQALERLARGDTLASVASNWGIGTSALCMALIAYAPAQWRSALISQALAQMEAISSGRVKLTRSQERLKLLEWRIKRAMLAGMFGPLCIIGRELRGPCLACQSARGVWVRSRKLARCFDCGWEGERTEYLSRIEQLMVNAVLSGNTLATDCKRIACSRLEQQT